ncbi:MAG: ATP-binding protein [Muribaculaceae bacterium]|nr:ATP-binding protein [Muribaculaceae bacterium]
MKDLRGIKGSHYIASLIEQGEHEQQDFKFAIPDSRKIARSISAFANHSGGRLLIGVKDNGTIAGVRSEEDVYMVEQAAELFCDPPQQIVITPFRVDGGILVVRVEIPPALHRPVCVRENGGELKAYFRVRDENILASPLMVRAWRQAADPDNAPLIQLDATARSLLALAAREQGVDLNEFMLSAHLSEAVAEQLAVTLHCMHLLDFKYIDGRFKLSAIDIG